MCQHFFVNADHLLNENQSNDRCVQSLIIICIYGGDHDMMDGIAFNLSLMQTMLDTCPIEIEIICYEHEAMSLFARRHSVGHRSGETLIHCGA
jgi:hypothetical protein